MLTAKLIKDGSYVVFHTLENLMGMNGTRILHRMTKSGQVLMNSRWSYIITTHMNKYFDGRTKWEVDYLRSNSRTIKLKDNIGWDFDINWVQEVHNNNFDSDMNSAITRINDLWMALATAINALKDAKALPIVTKPLEDVLLFKKE